MGKKYAIVRVDDKCPLVTEDNFYCSEYLQKDKCKKCKEIRGDTKEQMIQKILQVIIIDIVKTAKVNDKKIIQILYKANYKLAKFIVEFLGVE